MGKMTFYAAAAAALMLAATMTACDDGKSAAADAAGKLAAGLSQLDVSSLSFTGTKDGPAATAELKAIAKSLDPVKPQVSVAAVDVKDHAASTTLNVKWSLGGSEWNYSTNASLSSKDGTWSAQWTPELLVKGLAEGHVLSLAKEYSKRADILGSGGAVLVTQRPVIRLGLDKSHVDAAAQDKSARALAALAGVDADGYAGQVAAAGPAAFVEALTIRDDASRTITDAQIAQIPGASGIKDTLALAPSRTFARALLGTVGPATAELIEASHGALSAGDAAGLSGLEKQYDGQLRGTAGLTVSDRDPAASGTGAAAAKVMFNTAPKAGTPVTTTLNPALQSLGESVLAEQSTPAAIVAIRPSTGEVVAAADSPGSNGYDTALLGQYAPGSTFKVATSLALLRKGQTPDSVEHCTPDVTVDGKVFHNAGTYPAAHLGEIPLRDAFAHSCNTAFISARDVAAQSDLASAAASLGVGNDPGLGAPAFFGSVPGTATGTEHAASMIGQGQVLVSPLAIATVAASVEQGARVAPKLVVAAAGGATAAPSATAGATPAAPLTPGETAALKDMMRGVVTSGHAGFLTGVPGAPVIAKTGTAEYGSDTPLKTHAWIIAAQADLAVAVFVENGDYGSVSGGPLLTAFLTGAQGK